MNGRAWLALGLLLAVFLARAWLYASILPLNGMPDEVEHLAQVRLAQYWPEIQAGRTDEKRVAGELVARFREAAAGFPETVVRGTVPAGTTPTADRLSLYNRLLGGGLRLLGVADPLRAWYLCRWASILLGLATLALAWGTAMILFPDRPLVALLAAGLIGLLPQFAAVAATVNPDNLASLAAAAFFCYLAWLLKAGPGWRGCLPLLLFAVLLLVLKKTTHFLLPLLLLGGLWGLKVRLAGRKRAWAVWLLVLLAAAGAVGLILFWPPAANRVVRLIGIPFYRTWQPGFDPVLFRQPGIFNVLAQEIRLADPGFWLHLKTLIGLFFKSFWAYFGYLDVPLDWWWYAGLALLLALGAAGWPRVRGETLAGWRGRCLVLFLAGLILSLAFIFLRQVLFFPGSLAQGRHAFPVLVPLALLWALGFETLWPARLRPWAAGLGLGFVWLTDLNAMWTVALPWFYRLHL